MISKFGVHRPANFPHLRLHHRLIKFRRGGMHLQIPEVASLIACPAGAVFLCLFGEAFEHGLLVVEGLKMFQQDIGEYPDSLKLLTANKFLKELPMDPFSGKPFIYKRAGKGYLLYSVGMNAKDDGGRRVRDGEVQPACVQTCPAEALVFGNRKDPKSRVSQTMKDPRAYRVLDELNTQPSVVYLKKVDANG